MQRWGELSPNRDNVVVVLHALTGDSHVTGPAGSGPPHRRLVGRRGRTRRADRHRPLVRHRHQRAGRLPGLHRAEFARSGRKALGFTVSRDHGARSGERRHRRADGARHHRRSPPSSAGPWAARGRWSGSSATPTPCGRRWCSPSGARATADQIGTQSTQVVGDQGRPELAGRRLLRHRAHARRRHGDRPPLRAPHLPRRDRTRRRGSATTRRATRTRRHGGRYAVQSYLEHQGDKLAARFDAGTYVALTDALEQSRRRPRPRRGAAGAARLHGARRRRRHHLRPALSAAPAGGTGRAAAGLLRDSTSSTPIFGHDGFLVETDAVGELIRQTLEVASR